MHEPISYLTQVCLELAVRVQMGFSVQLKSGEDLRAYAHIPSFGAPNGMLVFLRYEDIAPYRDEVLQSGYGFSVLEEPNSNVKLDLAVEKKMFADWCWTGDPCSTPTWMEK